MITKGCIFDLDGVIVDTARYHFLSWKRLADSLDIPFTKSDNEKLKGVSRVDSLNMILALGGKDLSQERKNELMDLKNSWYLEYIDKMGRSEILPGVLDFLEELRSNNIHIALGSSSKNARRILDRLEIKGYFDAIVDGTDVSRSKPDPEVFLKGAEALGLSPAECVVFEDANAGVRAALDGGFQVVGIHLDENEHGIDTLISDTRSLGMHLLS